MSGDTRLLSSCPQLFSNHDHSDVGKPFVRYSADSVDVQEVLRSVPVQAVGVVIGATTVSSLSDNSLGHRCVLEQDVHGP